MKYFPSHASQGRAWYIRKCSLAWLPKIRITDGLVQGCSISVANALLKDTAVLHWTIDIRFRRKHCLNALAQMAVLHAPDHWAVGYLKPCKNKDLPCIFACSLSRDSKLWTHLWVLGTHMPWSLITGTGSHHWFFYSLEILGCVSRTQGPVSI